jgi:hypothetical protein
VAGRSGSATGLCRLLPSAPAPCRRPGGASRQGPRHARWSQGAAHTSSRAASRPLQRVESCRPC